MRIVDFELKGNFESECTYVIFCEILVKKVEQSECAVSEISLDTKIHKTLINLILTLR